jgi:Ca2+-binding RTX toxin-like protein
VDVDDVVVSEDGGVITLSVGESEPDAGDGVEVSFQMDLQEGGTEGVDEVVFDGGAVWTREDIRNLLFGVTGTSGDDTIDGTSWSNNVDGAGGNDLVQGYGGDDTLARNAGGDTVAGGARDDLVSGGAGNDVLYGADLGQLGSGADTLDGGTGDDTIHGGSSATRYLFEAGHGRDVIREAGVLTSTILDVVAFGVGILPADILVSRDGFDIVLSHINGLDAVRIEGVFSASDLRYAVERVEFASGVVWTRDDLTFKAAYIGTSSHDTLAGSIGPDSISGVGDNDRLDGYEGNDALSGGIGTDTLDGGSGHDTLEGGDNEDQFLGSSGNDVLGGNASADSLSGGDNDDQLEGHSGADTLNGGNGADTLLAGDDADSLSGSAGNDVLNGGDGVDTLIGGAGADTFSGGNDADYFRFDIVSDISGDVISDFGGFDLIDLSIIDAKSNASGNQAFTWIGSFSFSNTAGELRFSSISNGVAVSGDTNGDGVADFVINVTGAGGLSAADFVL